MDSDYDGWQPEMDSDYDGWQLENELYTDQELIEYIRNSLKAREDTISFRPGNNYNEDFSEYTQWVKDRVFEHNYGGPGDEGDYLKAICYIPTNSYINSVYFFKSISYSTTYEQEKRLTECLSGVYQMLELNNLSDYEKVVKIHDYLVLNCEPTGSSEYCADTACCVLFSVC